MADEAHVAAIEVTLDRGFFNSYKLLVPEFKACVDLKSINDFLSACKGKMVDLKYNEDRNAFILTSGNLSRRFGLISEENGTRMKELPTIALPSSVSIIAKEIKPAIKASLTLGATGTISIDKDGFHIQMENETDEITSDVGKDFLEELNVKEATTSQFNFLLLAEYFNTIKPSALLDITMGTDRPIMIQWFLDKEIGRASCRERV